MSELPMVQCPNCDEAYMLNDEAERQTVECDSCGCIFSVNVYPQWIVADMKIIKEGN